MKRFTTYYLFSQEEVMKPTQNAYLYLSSLLERLFSPDQHANKPIRVSFLANQPINVFVPVSYFMLGSRLAE